jgi:hypothetical protein
MELSGQLHAPADSAAVNGTTVIQFVGIRFTDRYKTIIFWQGDS